MLVNEDIAVIFRVAGNYNLIAWLMGARPFPKTKNLKIDCYEQEDGSFQLILLSYEKVIALRHSCKEEECDSCPNQYRCIHESRTFVINEETYQEDPSESRVKYIVTDISVPIRKLGNTRQAKYIQRHIELVNEWLKDEPSLNQKLIEEYKSYGVFLHPSTIYTIVEHVDCWADEVKY